MFQNAAQYSTGFNNVVTHRSHDLTWLLNLLFIHISALTINEFLIFNANSFFYVETWSLSQYIREAYGYKERKGDPQIA